MRTAGVREARKNLSALLDEVRKRREVVITKRGRPVAKLVPPDRPRGKGVPNLAAFRRKIPIFEPPLSTTGAEDRADRLKYHWFQKKPWQEEIKRMLASGLKWELDALANKDFRYLTKT